MLFRLDKIDCFITQILSCHDLFHYRLKLAINFWHGLSINPDYFVFCHFIDFKSIFLLKLLLLILLFYGVFRFQG